MKVKAIFKFILVFSIVIGIYFAIILNIDSFMISYQGKLEEYKNVYYKERNSETSVLSKLQYLEEKYENISKEDIEKIKNNEIIKNIMCKNLEIKEDELEGYIEKLMWQDRIKLIRHNFDIIYIQESYYEIAFSTDGNNIVYEARTGFQYNRNWEAQKITEEDKNKIYKEMEKELEKLGITKKFHFDPGAIYIKYYNEIIADWDGEVYVVEDNTNHMRLEFEVPSYTITSLQIGFEDFKMY